MSRLIRTMALLVLAGGPFTTVTAQDISRVTAELDREHFYTLFVSVRGELVGFETIAVGGMSGVEVHPREVFRGAMLAGAFAIVVAHNHPSGDPSPSAEDRALTQRLHRAGEIVGIPVYDHIIVGGGGMYSFAQDGGL